MSSLTAVEYLPHHLCREIVCVRSPSRSIPSIHSRASRRQNAVKVSLFGPFQPENPTSVVDATFGLYPKQVGNVESLDDMPASS